MFCNYRITERPSDKSKRFARGILQDDSRRNANIYVKIIPTSVCFISGTSMLSKIKSALCPGREGNYYSRKHLKCTVSGSSRPNGLIRVSKNITLMVLRLWRRVWNRSSFSISFPLSPFTRNFPNSRKSFLTQVRVRSSANRNDCISCTSSRPSVSTCRFFIFYPSSSSSSSWLFLPA